MGLFSTLSTSVTGLNANSTTMNVIGDNIANVNTYGFKSSKASFQDLLTQNVIGAAGMAAVGKGVRLADIAVNFGQASFENSTNATDLAINGNGFFVVRDPAGGEQLFTRAGQFFLDPEGKLLAPGGQVLQGYTATNGSVGTALGDIQISTNVLAPSATTETTINANLYSGETAAAGAAVTNVAAAQFFYSDLNDNSHYSTSVKVYDSLGEAHDMTVHFQKVGTDQWSFVATVNTSEVTGGNVAAGDATQVGNGTLNFLPDGTIDTTTSVINVTAGWGGFVGADPNQTIALDMVTNGSLTQYGQESALTAISQDGFGAGFLNYIEVDSDGIIGGVYSNGQRRELGQVALATFSAQDGLQRRGGNMFAATLDSSDPAIGAANTGGRGGINSYSLELSNVDLETEFVRMIGSQLGYQANSRVMSTTNTMLQQLVQIIG